jgi:hypothetical protein
MLYILPDVLLWFYCWYFISCWNQIGICIKMDRSTQCVTFKLAVRWYKYCVGLFYRATCIHMPILWLCMFCVVTRTLSGVKTGFVL